MAVTYSDPTYLDEAGFLRCRRHGKVMHERRSDAVDAAARKRDPDLSPYRCRATGAFHLGHHIVARVGRLVEGAGQCPDRLP